VEREKKNLVPNSVRTRPGQENSEKNSKKILKTKNVNSRIISIRKGLREVEKEKEKNLVPNSVRTRAVQENSEKK